jgi:CheY-like chemotaxis protein
MENLLECADNNPVLLVEDNPDDILITRRAWKIGQIENPLFEVRDGKEALTFLRKEGEYTEAPKPSLIILDLRMPRLNGLELLEIIKEDDSLKKIPVVVLTASNKNKDVEKALQLGCDDYIVKPVTFQNFIKVVIEIKRYWLSLCEIPNSHARTSLKMN